MSKCGRLNTLLVVKGQLPYKIRSDLTSGKSPARHSHMTNLPQKYVLLLGPGSTPSPGPPELSLCHSPAHPLPSQGSTWLPGTWSPVCLPLWPVYMKVMLSESLLSEHLLHVDIKIISMSEGNKPHYYGANDIRKAYGTRNFCALCQTL